MSALTGVSNRDMRSSLLGLCLLSAVTAACKAPRPPQSPAQPAEGESFVPPFEAEHPYRGPGLVLYGMRLVGERGACQLSITAFDHGRDIVFDVTKSRETPADWLDACPRSAPGEGGREVSRI